MMTTHHDRHYKAGGDPRTLADFMALRAEMNKLSHPARPDINWPYAEQLARGLLEHHGADLQTVAWYTLALSLIHISEPTRLGMISYAVFCLKKKNNHNKKKTK